jgi:hypothetical protein
MSTRCVGVIAQSWIIVGPDSSIGVSGRAIVPSAATVAHVSHGSDSMP